MLGDCAPALMSEDDIADYILDFAAELSGGSMPVIYVRGNHETRGRAAAELAECIGYNQFYYTTSLGNYDFVVLDSCEDKEDSHPEYGGMVDYQNYRTDMVEWLESLEKQIIRRLLFAIPRRYVLKRIFQIVCFQNLIQWA